MEKSTHSIQDSEILNHLYNDTGRKGELVAMRFRWFLMVLIAVLIVHMYSKGLKHEALYSLIPLIVFGLYNVFLLYRFKKPKINPWIRYLSTTIDISILSFHIFNYARLFNPIAVVSTASIFLYPVLMFLAVLRYDRKLILYSTALTLVFFNLNYFLFMQQIPSGLMDKVVSADPAGQLYKSGYFLFLGYLYTHIPRLLSTLLSRQKRILTEKNKTEIALVREQERVVAEKEVNDTLSQLNFTKDKLFSVIGHDVKNPFSVIHSLSKSLIDQQNNLPEDDLAEGLHKIHSASGKGLDLLQNLLNWSRAQRNMIKPHFVTADIYPLIVDVFLFFEESAKAKEITLRNHINKDHKAVIDNEMFHTIVRNIVSNSIKYTQPQGTIVAVSRMENASLCIEISDSGTGIPKETLHALQTKKIYKSTPGTHNEKGTGLGMLIVQDFVHALKGELHIHSEQNKGTSITIRIPHSDG